ncbi:hypothetical protein BCR33DRAFT_839450 [Rhizoclosmatium globosum]|uniref:Uncharacterized protein n=1 Tax=Rhizoclosmatium globosum TaxID=329046 RepID=A0A1Y2CUB9_9FUNG|nr:hypothetical protein BCR33DRAFT_839450 [Rhizoclosmatium globosum]|eukprot:ORY50592.1 hypothetical protein BCR33DRAFT_839450 [Rhizoclosmatium globosum]
MSLNTTLASLPDPRAYMFIPSLVSSTLLLIALVIFLARHQNRFVLGNKKITPIGQVLLWAYSSFVLLFIFELVQVYVDIYSIPTKVSNSLSAFCLATIELCSIRYFWLISCTIVDMTMPRIFHHVENSVVFLPLCFYVQFLTATLLNIYRSSSHDTYLYNLAYEVSVAAAGLFAVLCNSFFLCVFCLYLRKSQENEELQSDPKLTSISRHGIFIAGLSYLSSILYIIALVVRYDEFWSRLLDALNLAVIHAAGWVSFAMKVSTWRMEEEKRVVGNDPEIQRLRRESATQSFEQRRSSQLAEEIWEYRQKKASRTPTAHSNDEDRRKERRRSSQTTSPAPHSRRSSSGKRLSLVG